ncbi:MAG: hypothetical protein V7723_13090 [Sneathiella sp.]|uniref:hypothetical protein n=1 Tax=Sneathiella sp. TaxID=1964365 RepID=UPI00300315FB
MNTFINSSITTEDADITFGANGDVITSQNQIFPSALKGASNEDGNAVADWQAGFLLGVEGDEIVETAVSDVGELGADAQLGQAIESEEGELLYIEDEENLVGSLAHDQSMDEEYFDSEAFGSSSDTSESISVFVAELKPFLASPVEGTVNLDTLFDAMGLSENRITDENLYFDEPSIKQLDSVEDANLFGNNIIVTSEVSFSDLDFGKMIDQMADQMFISNES